MYPNHHCHFCSKPLQTLYIDSYTCSDTECSQLYQYSVFTSYDKITGILHTDCISFVINSNLIETVYNLNGEPESQRIFENYEEELDSGGDLIENPIPAWITTNNMHEVISRLKKLEAFK